MNATGEPLDRVSYVKKHKDFEVDEQMSAFEALFRPIKRFQDLDKTTPILEIGIGTGWLQVICGMKGLSCSGLEKSPQLAEYAREFGRRYSIATDITVGSIEDTDIGISKYDVIIANSTFEHVEKWQTGLKRVYEALKPGGLFYFYSTNKFSFVQGEYDIPLYGWLPNSWRYRLRRALQGEDIMNWGIDFNQFTYFELRRFFRRLGFSSILDLADFLDPDQLENPRFHKRIALKVLKRVKPLKHLVLFFSSGTAFICIK